jgi:hypothetical protein
MGLAYLLAIENDLMYRKQEPTLPEVQKLLERTPDALAYQSAKIKDHDPTVRRVLEKDGRALVYASERLRNDPDLCALALSHPMEPHERATVLAAIGDQARADKTLMVRLCALLHSLEPLYRAHESVRDDFDTMVACARIDGRSVLQASERLRSDVDFALAVAQHNPLHLTFMASDIRNLEEAPFFDVEMDGAALHRALLARKQAQTLQESQGQRVFEWLSTTLQHARSSDKAI